MDRLQWSAEQQACEAASIEIQLRVYWPNGKSCGPLRIGHIHRPLCRAGGGKSWRLELGGGQGPIVPSLPA